MDLKKLIGKNLNVAFKAVDSLAVTATFHLKTVSGFNFATGRPDESDPKDVVARAIILDSKKKKEGFLYKNLLVKSAALLELGLYDKVTVQGLDGTWTVGDPLVDNGYTQLLEVYKGV
jgi:hypothetical protein